MGVEMFAGSCREGEWGLSYAPFMATSQGSALTYEANVFFPSVFRQIRNTCTFLRPGMVDNKLGYAKRINLWTPMSIRPALLTQAICFDPDRDTVITVHNESLRRILVDLASFS